MSKQASSPNGDLNEETTEIPQGTPSTNVEPSGDAVDTSATLGEIAEPKSPMDSQLTPNLTGSTQSEDVQADARMLIMFGEKLMPLVEWQRVELGDGRTGIVLFFDDAKWILDPIGRKITPR